MQLSQKVRASPLNHNKILLDFEPAIREDQVNVFEVLYIRRWVLYVFGYRQRKVTLRVSIWHCWVWP